MEVRVHAAEIKFQLVKGFVEVESGKQIRQVSKNDEASFPAIVQTLKKAHAKFRMDFMVIALAPDSMMEITDKGECKLLKGSFWIDHQIRKPPQTWFHVPQGAVGLAGAALISVKKEKTRIDVLSGEALLTERLPDALKLKVPAGFSSWIGGRLESGYHAFGDVESSDGPGVISRWARVSMLSDEGFRDKLYLYKPIWQRAVEITATTIQRRVLADFAAYDAWKKQEDGKIRARLAERNTLKRLYQAKVLGVPGKDEESPSESLRSPASDWKSGDIERSDIKVVPLDPPAEANPAQRE